jgi:hypothetical protein
VGGVAKAAGGGSRLVRQREASGVALLCVVVVRSASCRWRRGARDPGGSGRSPTEAIEQPGRRRGWSRFTTGGKGTALVTPGAAQESRSGRQGGGRRGQPRPLAVSCGRASGHRTGGHHRRTWPGLCGKRWQRVGRGPWSSTADGADGAKRRPDNHLSRRLGPGAEASPCRLPLRLDFSYQARARSG